MLLKMFGMQYRVAASHHRDTGASLITCELKPEARSMERSSIPPENAHLFRNYCGLALQS